MKAFDSHLTGRNMNTPWITMHLECILQIHIYLNADGDADQQVSKDSQQSSNEVFLCINHKDFEVSTMDRIIVYNI